MDTVMPNIDGFDAYQAIKTGSAARSIPVVPITPLGNSTVRGRGLDIGANAAVSKTFDSLEVRARVRSLTRLRRFARDLDRAEAVVVSLALTIEARDRTTAGHCQRLAKYASELGRALGLDTDDVATLAQGGYVHDIGKIAIPDAVLQKPGPLTAEEFDLVKEHATIGHRLCGEIGSLRKVSPIVRHHHERLDGSGYPDGLRGDDIPLLAQLMGIVDVFDALTTSRPYKVAMPVEMAADELRDQVARGWRRSDLVETFLGQVTRDGRVRGPGAPLPTPPPTNSSTR